MACSWVGALGLHLDGHYIQKYAALLYCKPMPQHPVVCANIQAQEAGLASAAAVPSGPLPTALLLFSSSSLSLPLLTLSRPIHLHPAALLSLCSPLPLLSIHLLVTSTHCCLASRHPLLAKGASALGQPCCSNPTPTLVCWGGQSTSMGCASSHPVASRSMASAASSASAANNRSLKLWASLVEAAGAEGPAWSADSSTGSGPGGT